MMAGLVIVFVIIENAIKTLLNHGVAWEDRQNFIKNQTKNDNIIYWFPGLNNK